jgi:hypothetical protein
MHVTSLFLLAAQFLSLGHLLLVRHITCPQHGDIIHASRRHEALPARLAVDEDASYGQSVAGTVARAESVHDHCLVCTSTHERFALLPPAGQPLASVEVTVPTPPSAETGPFAPVDLILLSPKSSPPAA